MIRWLLSRSDLIERCVKAEAELVISLRDRGRMVNTKFDLLAELRALGDKLAEASETNAYLTDRNAQLAAESHAIVASNHALLERAEKAEGERDDLLARAQTAEAERDALEERGAELGCHLKALLDTIKDLREQAERFAEARV